MNPPINIRKKQSQEKIKKSFIQLIQHTELNKLTVMDIIKDAKVNRSTFYANYLDVYDLADKLKDEMFNDLVNIYTNNNNKERKHYNDFLKMFQNIKENQIYYKTLFKLNVDYSNYADKELDNMEAMKYFDNLDSVEYHKAFFTAGLIALIKMWLARDCDKSPEEINKILIDEYKRKNLDK